MNHVVSLNKQINRVGFWSVMMTIITLVISFLLPLDAPGGYSATHADRAVWLAENRGMFILGWLNQILAMFALSGVWFSIAWQIREQNALRALIATLVVTLSIVAFIIPKFMAVWTIPMLADSLAANTAGTTDMSAMANTLLLILNVSIPYSLYTAFDYLGFWLYAVFGCLVAGPLYAQRISSKVAAVALGLFGVIYHLLLATLFFGYIEAAQIETWFFPTGFLPVIAALVMIVPFMHNMKSA